MAQRRMFTKKIIDSAKFLKMPSSSRLLYFDLGMRADDDGVVEAFNVLRMTGATEDDLKVLVSKGYIKVLNEDLVSYITDWREHNYIRADRKIDSMYKNLLLQMIPEIDLLENKKKFDNQMTDICQPNDGIGKVRLGKVKLDKYINIIEYLNSKTNSKFKSTTTKTKKLIDARLNEGFTEEDFKTVIDKKTKDWINNKDMSRYLRPETLFGTKFEGYLNEKVEDKPKQKINSPYKEFEFED